MEVVAVVGRCVAATVGGFGAAVTEVRRYDFAVLTSSSCEVVA